MVLVVSSDPRLRPALATRFRQQLAASGTALYVLDATVGGAPAYDALAAPSGGLAVRIRAPGAWTAAFGRIAAQLGEQYYLRFTDTAPLPAQVSVLVGTPRTILRAAADLPVANPAAPPPLPASAPAPPVRHALWDRPLGWLAALLIILGISYGLAMFAASRRDPVRPRHPGVDPSGIAFYATPMADNG